MGDRQVIEGELAEMVPGTILGAVLGAIERSRLNGHDLVTVVQARARRLAHLQAQLLADVAELAHCPPGAFDAPVARVPDPDEFVACELAAALHLTRVSAEAQLSLAVDVVDRLPAVHAALLAGELDLPRVRVIVELTATLEQAEAREVVDAVLPDAASLTTSRLAARLRKLLMTADPDAAKKRHDRSMAGRRVHCLPDRDGTASIYADGLPADRAAAAIERIDAMAKAAKCGGDPRGMDQLRTDAFLDLLTGAYPGPGPVHRAGVVELTVPLTTLMQLSDASGEIAGFGPVIADIARQVATAQPRAQWRWSVWDPDTGRLLQHGSTRRRPRGAGRPGACPRSSMQVSRLRGAGRAVRSGPCRGSRAGRRYRGLQPGYRVPAPSPRQAPSRQPGRLAGQAGSARRVRLDQPAGPGVFRCAGRLLNNRTLLNNRGVGDRPRLHPEPDPLVDADRSGRAVRVDAEPGCGEAGA
ncbi:MAG TPA: DUF222 domain-containing protein, partial [Micromonosporaceae bacterium]|nr:DUF222 domain-containing protein [Micromonosporaceae bacterium]